MSSGAGPAARLCRLERGPDGYGFHLHGEKGKPGQFIRLVEAGSPAERSGLRAGDRLLEVDGENVERESHQQVVERIRAAAGTVSLLVVDSTADEQLSKRGGAGAEPPVVGGQAAPVPVPVPVPVPAEPAAREPNGGDQRAELRPRLCLMKKGPDGYGFNLHSDKSRPGQYVRAVDPNSPAEAAGLAPQDRIIEVNGVCMEGKQHSDVVAAIKASGDETRLLVVDVLTDEFFKKCKVVPSEQHLTGGLGAVLRGWGFVSSLSALCHLGTKPWVLGCSLSPGRWRFITLGPSRVTWLWCLPACLGALCWGGGADVGGFMALGCTSSGFMPWEVKRHQLPFALLHGPLPAVTVVPRRMGRGSHWAPYHYCHCGGCAWQHLPVLWGWLQGLVRKLRTVPVANGDIEKENSGEPQSNSVSESPSSPAPLAVSPNSSETHSEPHTQEGDKRHSASGSLLDLDIPLAVAKERAHQKRTSKRAPQMDWSKKNELFSNL